MGRGDPPGILPWGLGVHGDQRALKKKRQGDLGTARHGLTKAINPSPRGPRDPRTWEEEFWRGRESGLQRIAARPGRGATRAGVNCTAPLLLARHPRDARPGARRRRGIENWRRRRSGSADWGRRGGDRKKKGKKKSFCVDARRLERGARGARHDDVARQPGALLPCLLHGFQLEKTQEYGVVLNEPLVLEVEGRGAHGRRRRRGAAPGTHRGGQSGRSDSSNTSCRPARRSPE